MIDNSIKPIKESMVMPYEQHLKDVYEVAKGISAPSYHTPNSIRHIIETICNFESPASSVSTFFKRNEELKKNDFVFSLINDCSHGIIRNQKAYTDEMVVTGCKALIDYINDHYKGQLSKMKANQF
jgi:hypothetical protein